MTADKIPQPEAGPTGNLVKGDHARQKAPEYVKETRVSHSDNTATPADKKSVKS